MLWILEREKILSLRSIFDSGICAFLRFLSLPLHRSLKNGGFGFGLPRKCHRIGLSHRLAIAALQERPSSSPWRIPYRYKFGEEACLKDSEELELEVLVISSKEGNGMLFPKGGRELDESKKEAALRETIEETDVPLLGVSWGNGVSSAKLMIHSMKTHDSFYEGCMFPLLIQEQLDLWLPTIQQEVQQLKLLYMGLYLLIQGKAANLKHANSINLAMGKTTG